MYIDVAVKVWQRIELNEEDVTEEEIITLLKKHSPNTTFLWNIEKLDPSYEIIVETETPLNPEEEGMATVELYNDDGILLWSNYVEPEYE